MSAAVARAHQLSKAGGPEARGAVELADVFCRMMRRRIREHFHAMRSNDDVRKYKTARRILDGEHEWLEKGLVFIPELHGQMAPAPSRPRREPTKPVLAPTACPSRAPATDRVDGRVVGLGPRD